MVYTGGIGVIEIKPGKMENIQDIQEITGMFADGFYVNTGVTDFIDEVLCGPGNLIGIGEVKEPIIIDRDLCIRISKLFYINNDISGYPIKDKYFYVNIGLLSFIHRVLKVAENIPTSGAMLKKDYLLKVFKHPLICSVITKEPEIK